MVGVVRYIQIHYHDQPLHLTRDEYDALIEALLGRRRIEAEDLVKKFLKREKDETQPHTDD